MRLRVDLDPATAAALVRAAVRDNRPVDLELLTLLERALGVERCACGAVAPRPAREEAPA